MEIKAMRDVFLQSLFEKMQEDDKIFFITADFGSPVLDKIKKYYPNRFINVGIAEQNLINVATGLALEGYIVYAYAIAPFITMRCYEQIRVNIAILSQVRKVNINLIGVGAGVSYTVSGPTHHCLEDLSIMNTLPNIEVFSPSDYKLAEAYVDRTIELNKPKYIRFDAKPMNSLTSDKFILEDGFRVLRNTKSDVCIVSTGYMSHKALEFIQNNKLDIKIVDLYFLNNFNLEKLKKELEHIRIIISLEEGFIGAGGLDSVINKNFKNKNVHNLGFEKSYTFEIGDRDFVHNKNILNLENIKNYI